MYLSKANRGLNLTASGRYLIGLTLVIGGIAVITGINGMFLFLGITLGLFSVSGVLSEKSVRALHMPQQDQIKLVDVGVSDHLTLEITHKIGQSAVFGVELQVSFNKPQYRWQLLRFKPLASSQLLALKAGARDSVHFKITCPRRGYIDRIYCRIETRFPFGIFRKYKLAEVSCRLFILPVYRADKESYWRNFARQIQNIQPDGAEFLHHSPYTVRDSAKLIDWKKSAGRLEKDWVIKKRQQTIATQKLVLSVDPSYVLSLSSSQFENLLAEFRTAWQILKESFGNLQVDLPESSRASFSEPVGGVARLALLEQQHFQAWRRRSEKDKPSGDHRSGCLLVYADRGEIVS